MNNTNNTISWRNILIALVFLVLGYGLFTPLQGIKHRLTKESDLDLFWLVWSTLESKYPFEEPSSEEKIHGAIRGLVDAYGDEYSSFLPPARSEFFNQTISGEFGGIGAEIGIRSGYLSVVAPLKNSPAESAGVLAGDIITHADAIDVADKTLDEAIGLIRGKIGTDVVLTIVRSGEVDQMDITITRDLVHVPVIDTEIRDDVFVIHLYNFNETSSDVFKSTLIEFKESGHRKLLIDLRNNPGGYLTAAIEIASFFLPQGEIILREQGSLNDGEEIYRSHGYDLLSDRDITLKVLINEGSASASEILAGALQDNNHAQIAGERSYGKGSVQELIDLPENTSLKITTSKWLTPKGEHISRTGIEPDIEIASDYESEDDVQLIQALQLFK
jgi:carboxyl-terminal processing protease